MLSFREIDLLRGGGLGLLVALVFALQVSGCSTAPTKGEKSARADRTSGGGSQRGGGYYQDDGPADNTPDNLDAIPDAEPRAEPLHRFANRPYTVLGRNYVPQTALAPYKVRGIASWYGRKFHGRRTSSGEPYDMFGMTAAHPTLPIPSYARVTNIANRRSVIVRINDRGPFHDNRVIDLSYTAAHKLGIVGRGSGMVEVESIDPENWGSEPAMAEAALEAPAEPMMVALSQPPAPSRQGVADVAGQVYLQLAAFSGADNAQTFLSRARAALGELGETLAIQDGGGLYRVRLGPYADRSRSASVSDSVRRLLNIDPIVVQR